MRQIRNALRNAFEPLMSHFVEHERQHNRKRHADKQLQRTDDERVFNQGPKLIVIEKGFKVMKANPGTAQDAHIELVLFEGQDEAAHRNVIENDKVHNARQQHKI
ncbi:Uncharacterised protein [Paenibacillus thiaminolyticus]|nr:Uncharacterised protein [Paenibacillus thiaminolyticus]